MKNKDYYNLNATYAIDAYALWTTKKENQNKIVPSIETFVEWCEQEYIPQILDDKEKEFLKFMVDRVTPKIISFKLRKYGEERRYIAYLCTDDKIGTLPIFEEGTMYKGMKLERWYTIEELGL